MELKELREKKLEAKQKMDAFMEPIQLEKRGMDMTEQKEFAKLEKEWIEIGKKIEQLESDELLQRYKSYKSEEYPVYSQNSVYSPNKSNALRYFLTKRYNKHRPEWERDALALDFNHESLSLRFNDEFAEKAFGDFQTRALGDGMLKAGQATAAAELVPTNLADTIYQKTLAFGGLLNVVNKFTTADGAPMVEVVTDNTSFIGNIKAEGVDDDDAALTTNKITYGSYLISSGIQVVSFEQARDSAFPIIPFVSKNLGEGVGRKIAYYLINGTGSSQPTGIADNSAGLSTGVTATLNNAVTYSEIVDLIYSIDPSYWPNARFVIGVQFRKLLQKLVDDVGRPVWNETLNSNIGVGAAPTLCGYPVSLDANIASVASGAKVAAFGDFEQAVSVRLVGDQSFDSTDHRFWEKRASGYRVTQSFDSKIRNTSAAKWLKMGT